MSADPSANVSHFVGDVAAFRRFGFDSFKLDSCSGQKDIALWSNLLANSGPPVNIENCHNGPFFPQHGYKIIPGSDAFGAVPWCPFNFYRTSVDIEVLYASIFGTNLQSTIEFSRANLSFPGCWAYPDSEAATHFFFSRKINCLVCAHPLAPPPPPPPHPPPAVLEVGVTAGLHPGEVDLTFSEARAHFGAWCIASSPLILGLDIRNDAAMDAVWPIISNTEALAVNAAWAGGSGTLLVEATSNVTFPFCGFVYKDGCSVAAWQVFHKPLPGGGGAFLALNHGASALAPMAVELASTAGLRCGWGNLGKCEVRDVWAHAAAGTAQGGSLQLPGIPSHDSVFYVLTPTAPL